MQVMQCPSPACGRPFQLNRFAAHPSRPAELQAIVCPHCNHTIPGEQGSVYLTHTLAALQDTSDASLPADGTQARSM